MSAPQLLPFAKSTVQCEGGWSKGDALKIVTSGTAVLKLEQCDTAHESPHAVASEDVADENFGTVYWAGIVPVRVRNSASTSPGRKLSPNANGSFGAPRGTPRDGAYEGCVALEPYDLNASPTEEGLVMALFFPGVVHSA